MEQDLIRDAHQDDEGIEDVPLVVNVGPRAKPDQFEDHLEQESYIEEDVKMADEFLLFFGLVARVRRHCDRVSQDQKYHRYIKGDTRDDSVEKDYNFVVSSGSLVQVA